MVEEFDNGGELNNKKSEEQLAKESAFYKDYLREQEEKSEREKRLKREEAKKQQEQAALEAQKAMQEKAEALEKNKSIEESVKNKKVKQRKKRTFATVGLTTIVFGLGAGVGYALLNQPSYEIDCVSNNDDCVFTGEGKYQTGSIVNLGTTDIEGYRFKAWYFNNEMVSEEKDFSFKMDPSKSGTYYVVYEKLYTIDKHAVTNGTVTVDKVNAVKGELVTITATPNDNFFVSSMYYLEEGSATPVVIENNCFLMPEKNVEIVVEFSDIEYLIRTDELSCGTISTDKTKSVVNGRVNVEILLNDGYQIKRAYYRKDGELIKNNLLFDDGYYFEMPESNVSVYVDYELINYTINLDFDGGVGSNPAQLTYNVESETFVIADPVKIGYRFVGWTNTDTSEDYVDTIIETGSFGNLNLKANFEMVNYSIATGSTTHGSISVASSANYGDEVVISTQADLGYGLSELYYVLEGQANHISILNNTFIMPNANITIYAVFEEGSYSVSCQKVGQGVVSVSKPSAKQSEEVVVSVAPGVGYALNKLVYVVEGDSTEINIVNNTFIMPMANVTIYAEFVIVDYAIAKGAESNGTFSVSKTSANYNDEVTITATPSEGYAIDGVYYVVEGSATQYDIENLTFTMPAKNITVYVEFKAIDYTVTTDEIVSGGGVSVSNPTYTIGSQVQIIVTPDPGYDVDDMYYTIDGDDTHYPITDNSFIMPPGDVNIVVDFKLVDYTITKANCNHGSFSVSHQKANYNEQVTLTLLPNAGYQLLKAYYIASGSADQVLIVNNAFAMPLGDVTVYVEYVAINYEVSKALETNGTFSISKTTAIVNEEVVVTATANVGYEVKRIYYIVSGSSTEVLVSGSSFSMPANNVTIYVEFAAINYDVAIDGDSNGGSVSVSDPTYTIGSQVQVVVTPDPGYDVDDMYYTIDGDDTHYPITDNSFIMPPGNINIVVDFKLVDYTITKATCENGTFTISQDVANIGNVITITTQPNAGYELQRIYYVASGTSLEIDVTGTSFAMPANNVTVYVEFGDIDYQIVKGAVQNGTLTISKTSANYNDEIVVAAIANEGYELATVYYVEEGTSVQVPIVAGNFRMPLNNVTIYVEFSAIDYIVTHATTTNGTFTTSKHIANIGDTIVVNAQPNAGYELDRIYYIESGSTTENVVSGTSFVMPAKNITVYVEFAAITYSVVSGTSSDGTIIISGPTSTVGTQIVVDVTPNPGYDVDDMYYTIDGDDTQYPIIDNTFVMPPGDVSVFVDFKLIDYTITKATCENGSFTVSDDVANLNAHVTVQVSPNDGYELKSMYYIKEGTENKVNIINNFFLMPSSNITVYVEYKLIDYNVSIGSFSNGTITLLKSTANFNEEVQIEVTPNDGYLLGEVYYVLDGTGFGEDIVDNKFTMPNGNVTLYAEFIAIDYTVATGVATNGTLAVSKTTANVGDIINVVTTPNRGYSLKRVYYVVAGDVTEHVISASITMPANNINVYVEFEAINYIIAKAEMQNGSVDISKTTAVYGENVTVSVTPNTDYELDEIYYVIDLTQQKVVITGSEFVMPDENITVHATFKELILLTMNVDGDSTAYKVTRGDVLSSVVPNIDPTNAKTNNEYTCGLYLDEGLTQEADLTETISSNITLYTKKATLSSFSFTYVSMYRRYHVSVASSATSVVIPQEYDGKPVTQVDGGSGVTSIVLAKNITSISSTLSNANLEHIQMCGGSKDFVVEGNCLINKTTKTLYLGAKNAVIPTDGTIEVIGMYAFKGRNITSVVIPNSVTEIQTSAFENCRQLVSVDLGTSVVTVGKNAFKDCRGLVELKLSDTIETLGDSSFEYCFQITSVELPSACKSIGERCFANCNALKQVSFNVGLQTIMDAAFSGSGITEVVLPNTVTTIGINPFSVCSSLESIEMLGENNDYYSISNCLIYKPTKKIVSGCKTSIIPSGGTVLILGENSFLSGSVAYTPTIPEGVTTLEENSVNTNGRGAMYSSSISLPSTITSIAPGALKPFASISIIENSVYYSKDNCIIKKSNKELVYMGDNGAIPGGGEVLIIGKYAFDKIGFYKELVIPEGVTTINNNAFWNDCHKKIILPSTITSYASNAMARAWEVEEVVIKSSAVYNSFVWDASTYGYYNEELVKITVLSSVDDGSNTSYISNTSKLPYQYKNVVIDNEVVNVYYVTNPSNFHVGTITFDASGTTQSYSILMEGVVPNIDSIIPTEILNQATDGFYLDPDYQTKVDISLNWVEYMDSLTGELKLYVK